MTDSIQSQPATESNTYTNTNTQILPPTEQLTSSYDGDGLFNQIEAVRGSTIPWKDLTIANLEFAHEDKNSVCGRKAACSVNVRSQL